MKHHRQSLTPERGGVLRHWARGFSLIEVLAAMVVTTILLVAVLQVSGHARHITQMSRQEMNATKGIRSVMDALAGDLQNIVDQNGMTVFLKTDTNHCTQLAFFTQSRPPANAVGASGARMLAVAYQLSGNQIIRKTGVVTWDGADADPMKVMNNAIASTTFSIVADNILLFECVLETENAEVFPGPPPSQVPTDKPYLSATTITGTAAPTGFSACVLADQALNVSGPRIRRLNVSIAALDSQLLRLPNVQNMAAALQPNAIADGQIPCVLWNRVISSGSLARSNFPGAAVATLQIGQRTFQLK